MTAGGNRRSGGNVRHRHVEAVRAGLGPIVGRELVHPGAYAPARAQAEVGEVIGTECGHGAVLVGRRIGVIVVMTTSGGGPELVGDPGHPGRIVARRGGWIRSTHRPSGARQERDHGEQHRGAAKPVAHGRMKHPVPPLPCLRTRDHRLGLGG